MDMQRKFTIVDAHCHLNEVADDYVINETLPVTCGYSHGSNLKNIEIAKKLGVPFALGIAPQTAIKQDLKDLEMWAETIMKAKANAIGEIGLDYHWAENQEHVRKEKIVFERMIKLAEEMRLPVVIHSRKAELECLEWLEERKFSHGIMMHFFSGDEKTAARAVEMGAMISVTPLHSKERKKVINSIPLEHIVIETDAPYVVRTPDEVVQSAHYVAEVKNIDLDEVKAQTMKNALKFFNFRV